MSENVKYKKYQIGRYTYGKPKISSGDPKDLIIGSFSQIASGARIYIGEEHRADWITISGLHDICVKKNINVIKSKGPVIIGNDVWIGADALILSGVTIGDGAVIGARAVVTKNVEPYEVVAGNPAKHIRYRFSQEQIAGLLKLQWWDWDMEKIEEASDLLFSDRIDDFINQYSQNTVNDNQVNKS